MTAGALSHLRLVELGSGFASAYTAKLLADLGADVVKIEPPGGDATRKLGPFPAVGQIPRRAECSCISTPTSEGSCSTLGQPADLPAPRQPPRPRRRSHSRLRARRAGALRSRSRTWCSAVGRGSSRRRLHPSDCRGPHRDYRAYDLNLWNAGGIACLNGGGPGTDDLPPLRTFGYQSTFQAGLNAAVASLGAIFARETSGDGQHVEVSAQEALVTILELTYPFWPYCQMTASRLGNKPIQPLDFFECRDGWVFLCAVEEHQWKTFVEIMGSPEWAALDIFADRLQRAANWDALKPMIASWMAEQTVQELYQLLQRRRVPIAPVSTMGDLLSSKHLNARGFFVSFTRPRAGARRTPGAPYLLSRTPWTLRRPAPLLGEHTAEVLRDDSHEARAMNDKPLSRDPRRRFQLGLGGAVLHPPARASRRGRDPRRVSRATVRHSLIPPFADSQPGLNRSGYFNQYNQGKRSLTLNLKHPRALDVARRLITRSDVVAENFANGVMDRMGLGYEEVRQAAARRHHGLDLRLRPLAAPSRTSCRMGRRRCRWPVSRPSRDTRAGHRCTSASPTATLRPASRRASPCSPRSATANEPVKGNSSTSRSGKPPRRLLPDALFEFEMNGAPAGARRKSPSPNGSSRGFPLGRTGSLGLDCGRHGRGMAIALFRSSAPASSSTDRASPPLADRKRHEDEIEARLTRWTTTLPRRRSNAAASSCGGRGVPGDDQSGSRRGPSPEWSGILRRRAPSGGRKATSRGNPLEAFPNALCRHRPRALSRAAQPAKSSAKSSATPSPRSKRSPPTACSVERSGLVAARRRRTAGSSRNARRFCAPP